MKDIRGYIFMEDGRVIPIPIKPKFSKKALDEAIGYKTAGIVGYIYAMDREEGKE